MKKRIASFAVWLALAGMLYFFENNTGTRIVLLFSLLLPALPPVRRALLEGKEESPLGQAVPLAGRTAAERQEKVPGDVRAYQPGDPVNRIHWKLSAKRDEVLVRQPEKAPAEETPEETLCPLRTGKERKTQAEETQSTPRTAGERNAQAEKTQSPLTTAGKRNVPAEETPEKTQSSPRAGEERNAPPMKREAGRTPGRRFFRGALFLFLCSLLLLFLIPAAREGGKALLNRLFEASEAVNAYAYDRFQVRADQPVALAVALLLAAGISLVGMALGSSSRWGTLALAAGAVLSQVYFGLAFPAWVNVPLFGALACWMLRHPGDRRILRTLGLGLAAVSAAVLLLYPGTDPAAEAASEAVRDRLSQMTQSMSGALREAPAGETETRHVRHLSQTRGEREARPDREYRLVTVEEEQVSRPRWVNYLRIALLLLLTVALVILPFLPFALLNRRHRWVQEARKAFQSENIREAVAAIFQQVTAWLEAAGCGGGNTPYAEWDVGLTPEYARHFQACEKLFEEAAYSPHEMREEDRQQALALLKETEGLLLREAGWKQRLRLRYQLGTEERSPAGRT